MSKRTDQEALLADVLAEGVPGFSDLLLGETLRRARRRRLRRQAGRVGGALLLVLLGGVAIWRRVPSGKPAVAAVEIAQPELAPPPYQLVVSQPLPVTQLILTRPFICQPVDMDENFPAVVRTFGGGFREVGDEELLALVAPQTAALIRRGPHEAELVLVNSNPSEVEPKN